MVSGCRRANPEQPCSACILQGDASQASIACSSSCCPDWTYGTTTAVRGGGGPHQRTGCSAAADGENAAPPPCRCCCHHLPEACGQASHLRPRVLRNAMFPGKIRHQSHAAPRILNVIYQPAGVQTMASSAATNQALNPAEARGLTCTNNVNPGRWRKAEEG